MHPAIIVVGIIYIFGIWRFVAGYSRTNFNRDFFTKISLGLLWLPLLIVSKSYRANFTKALKG
ncbi:MAG: hypothetical protein SFT94_08135 [Pseudanabaenaceae cyanobacterium bins.68]|nr:hypothetical protein [Pseudanabaenaceae cyanobacterium bins.68]